MTLVAKYCPQCGIPLEHKKVIAHQQCKHCSYTIYYNPKVVGVGIIEVEGKVLLVKRREYPPSAKSPWALPGGYLEQGESWQQGLTREVREEIGIDIPDTIWKFHWISSTPNGSLLLLFAKGITDLSQQVFDGFISNDEIESVKLISSIEALSFPLHETALRHFWDRTADH